MFMLPQEVVEMLEPGQVFAYEGARYKLLKKTKSAVSIRRHYWFDELWDRVTIKKGDKSNGTNPSTPKFVG